MADVVLERTYPHAPERVWRALTDPTAIADWLMTPHGFEPRVGCRFQFRVPKPPPGWRGIVDCEVLVVDPPRTLAYSWQGEPKHRPTKVTWTIEPAPEGAHLKLVHSGFRGVGGMLLRWMLGGGWKGMVEKHIPDVLSRMTDTGYVPRATPKAC
jgi:uncharacterized protein YndB with AHSA1/START domain